MTTHEKLTEEQWAAAADATDATFDGALAPISRPAGPPEGTHGLAAFSDAVVTVDVLASRGTRGWLARIAADDTTHASVVRTLDTGRQDRRVGVVPGVELSVGDLTDTLRSVLRLVPGLEDGPVNPREVIVPTEHVGAVIAAAHEDDGRTRAALLDLLGWDEIPQEIESLDRIDGDITLTVAAPGRRTRMIRLLHGLEGWISMGIGRDGMSYRRATGPWLRAELAWELTAAMEAAR